MADRRVTHTAKGRRGDIVAIGNPETKWRARRTAEAILDIETGAHTYHVASGDSRTDVRVVRGRHGAYLRTDPNDERADNLDDLPDLDLDILPDPQPLGAPLPCGVAIRQLLGG